MKRKLQAIAVLLMLGLVKLPVEQSVTNSLRESKLLSPPLDLGLRENMGQMAFAASLGGLRSLVASITYLQAFTAFENVEWAKVDSLFQLTTKLQPGFAKYWQEGSWHMAYNAASGYFYDEKLRPAIRRQLARDHVKRGIDILEEGLRYLPEDPGIWKELAEIYARRGLNTLTGTFGEMDARKAGECYLRSYKFGGLKVYERMGAYQLVTLDEPEANRTAYEVLKENYGEGFRTPSLIHNLKLLENRLGVPMDQRIPDPEPAMKRRK